MEKDTNNLVIAFTHIPKTGGVSLRALLHRNLGEGNCLHACDIFGTPRETVVQRILPFAKQLRAVTGHFLWSHRIEQLFDHPTFNITIFRDPTERVISHYFFLKMVALDHPISQRIQSENISLSRYVSEPIHIAADNVMVRMLASDDTMSIPWGGIGQREFEQAKDNLSRRFDVVGFCERYENFTRILRDEFGWQTAPERHNVNPSRPSSSDIPESDKAAIRDLNRWDLQLYHFARNCGGETGVMTLPRQASEKL